MTDEIVKKGKSFYINGDLLYSLNSLHKELNVSDFIIKKLIKSLKIVPTYITKCGNLYNKNDLELLREKITESRGNEDVIKKGNCYYLNDEKLESIYSIKYIVHKDCKDIKKLLDEANIKSNIKHYQGNDLYTQNQVKELIEFIENKNKQEMTPYKLSILCNCDRNKIMRCLNYLDIDDKEYYNEEDLNKIKDLLNDENITNLLKNKTCQEKYGVDFYTQTEKYKSVSKKTCQEKYGVESVAQTEEVKLKKINTFREKYGADYGLQNEDIMNNFKNSIMEKYNVEHFSQTEEFKEKCKLTSLKHYGVKYYSQSDDFKKRKNEFLEKCKHTSLQHYGVEHPTQSDEIHKKIFSHRKEKNSGFLSKAENKFAEMLTNRNIDFENEYFYNGKHWDFAIFVNENGERKLNTLVEIDGEYNHGLISDFNGVHVKDQEDYGRFSLIEEGIKFIAIDSKRIEEGFSLLFETLNIDYEDWIKNIINSLPKEFPYHSYSDKRMINDYKHLCEYDYKNGQKLGYSIINNFHKSIYSCHVGNKPSPIEAWNDNELLEKCVRNRFIYKSNLSSQNIADGFNVCKIAPKVSIFNPSLAKHLIKTYLDEFDVIFDPFSGFSGRMLGTCSLGKRYIGQDVNEVTIKESIEIKNKFNLSAELINKDIFDSNGKYDCLFTCSPYNLKETWNNNNQKDLSCDEWIDVCLERFDCKKHLFVVDKTEKYKDCIVEEIENNSHFSNNKEFAILINNNII